MVELAYVSAAVIAFAIIMYVILDGFDLGIGILYPFAPGERARDVMINTIAPVWDGNETWLVFGGAILFAAFPLAYAVVLPALYVPVMLLLFALIFRGVAFEFRMKARRTKAIWSVCFCAGSTLAAFAQGLVLGGFIEGVEIERRAFVGGAFDWLSAFSIVCGFALVNGYALLGATWLVWRTDGALQAAARAWGRWLTAGVMVFMAIVSLYSPLAHEMVRERWFADLNLVLLSPVPIVTAITGLVLWRGLVNERWERLPFALSIALFLLGYFGLAISFWPYIVPPDLTIREAAAPHMSQLFTLVAVAFTMPMVLIYTGYAYWVFRGKVGAEGGYG